MVVFHENKHKSNLQKASFFNMVFTSGNKYFDEPWREHTRRLLRNLSHYNFKSNKFLIAGWLKGVKLSPSEIRKHFGKEVADILRICNKSDFIIKEHDDALIMTIAERITNMEYLFNNNKKELFEMYQAQYPEWRRGLYKNEAHLSTMWSELDYIMFHEWNQLFFCI